MARGKAEVNAQVAASELAVASVAVARGKAEVNARVAASELAVVAAGAVANVLVVDVRVAASVRAVVSVKVAVRKHLPIQRRSNSEPHRSVLAFCFSSPVGSDLRYSTRSSCSLGVNCKLNWML